MPRYLLVVDSPPSTLAHRVTWIVLDYQYQDSFSTQAFHGTTPQKPVRDPTEHILGPEDAQGPGSGTPLPTRKGSEGSRRGHEKPEEKLPVKPKRDPTTYVDGVRGASEAPSSRSTPDYNAASAHWSSCTSMDTRERDEYRRRAGRDPTRFSRGEGSHCSREGEATAGGQSRDCGSASYYHPGKSFRSRESTDHHESVESFFKEGSSYLSRGGKSSTSRGGKSRGSVSKCGWENSYAEHDSAYRDSTHSAERRTSFHTQEGSVGTNYSKGEVDPHFAKSMPPKEYRRSMRSDMSESRASRVSC